MRSVFLCFGGFFLGGITKEMVFMKKVKDNWPFTVKVTNWSIVADLADTPVEQQRMHLTRSVNIHSWLNKARRLA